MWDIQYGGTVIATILEYEAAENHVQNISEIIDSGGGWYLLQFPLGDGIGTHFLMVYPGVPVAIVQRDPADG